MAMMAVNGYHADVACVSSVFHGRFHEQLLHGAAEFLSRADFAELWICALAAPLILLWLGQRQSCQSWSPQLPAVCRIVAPSSPTAEAGPGASEKANEHDAPAMPPAPLGGLLIGMTNLPGELRSEVAQCLLLPDIAAANVASTAARRGLWEAPDVWIGLADQQGCSAALAAAVAEAPAGTGEHAAALREAFRKAAFRTDGSGLLALFNGSAPPQLGDFVPLFSEAAHVLSGLMPSDGGLAVKWLCEILSTGLRSYDATSGRMAAAAESLLKVARRREDILTEAQIQRLASENGHAADLARLLSSVMEAHDDQLERQYSDMHEGQLEALLQASQAA